MALKTLYGKDHDYPSHPKSHACLPSLLFDFSIVQAVFKMVANENYR